MQKATVIPAHYAPEKPAGQRLTLFSGKEVVLDDETARQLAGPDATDNTQPGTAPTAKKAGLFSAKNLPLTLAAGSLLFIWLRPSDAKKAANSKK